MPRAESRKVLAAFADSLRKASSADACLKYANLARRFAFAWASRATKKPSACGNRSVDRGQQIDAALH